LEHGKGLFKGGKVDDVTVIVAQIILAEKSENRNNDDKKDI